MKLWYRNFLLGSLPFLIILSTWGLEKIEAVIRINFRLINPALSWWLILLVRTTFSFVIAIGIWLFYKKKDAARYINLIWIFLGGFVVCLASPLAPYLRIALNLKPIKFPEPTHLVLIAGGIVLISGILGFIPDDPLD